MLSLDDQLKLISIEPDDAEVKSLLADEAILQNLSETRRYKASMPCTISFRIELDNKLIGEVRLQSIRWFNRKAEISIFIVREFQGKGFGKKALLALMRYGFRTMNFYRLEAEVAAFNKDGQKLFEKLGFIEEGRLREAKFLDGKYYDIIRYGMLRGEYDDKY